MEDDNFSKKRRNLIFICTIIVLYVMTHASINSTAISLISVEPGYHYVIERFGMLLLVYFMYRYYVDLFSEQLGKVNKSLTVALLRTTSFRLRLVDILSKSIVDANTYADSNVLNTHIQFYTEKVAESFKLKSRVIHSNSHPPAISNMTFNPVTVPVSWSELFRAYIKTLFQDNNISEYAIPPLMNAAAIAALIWRAVYGS